MNEETTEDETGEEVLAGDEGLVRVRRKDREDDQDDWLLGCRNLSHGLDVMVQVMNSPIWDLAGRGEVLASVEHKKTGKVLFEGTVWPSGKPGSEKEQPDAV